MVDINHFDRGDEVKLVMPVTLPDGTTYKAGWPAMIFAFQTPMAQCRARNSYEISLEEDRRSGRDAQSVMLPSAYFERTSAERKDGELRQGDRVKLLPGFRDGETVHGTILTTHITTEQISHDVALDYAENIRVPRQYLEHLPGRFAAVTYADDGSVSIDLGDNAS